MKTNEIVDVLIGKIKTLPNGTEITTSQLVKLCGLESECNSDGFFEPMGLFEIHNALFKAAEKEHIQLDMSKHDGKVEGLPLNLDFKVIHS